LSVPAQRYDDCRKRHSANFDHFDHLAKDVAVDIRLVSSLTAEDEDRFAPVILNALAELLDKAPVAYSIRIETAAGKTMQHSGSAIDRGTPLALPTDVRARRRESAGR
jgi:hypothetical protein